MKRPIPVNPVGLIPTPAARPEKCRAVICREVWSSDCRETALLAKMGGGGRPTKKAINPTNCRQNHNKNPAPLSENASWNLSTKEHHHGSTEQPHSSLRTEGCVDRGVWASPRLPPLPALPSSAPRVAEQELTQNCCCQPQVGFLCHPNTQPQPTRCCKNPPFQTLPCNLSSFSQAHSTGLCPCSPTRLPQPMCHISLRATAITTYPTFLLPHCLGGSQGPTAAPSPRGDKGSAAFPTFLTRNGPSPSIFNPFIPSSNPFSPIFNQSSQTLTHFKPFSPIFHQFFRFFHRFSSISTCLSPFSICFPLFFLIYPHF